MRKFLGLLVIIICLLTGCIHIIGSPSESITLQGIVSLGQTNTPIPNAQITVVNGNQTYPLQSDVNGEFYFSFHTKRKSFQIVIEHPDFQLWRKDYATTESLPKPLICQLEPITTDRILVTGPIDYALPQLPQITGSSSIPTITYTQQPPELTELIIVPYTYNEAEAKQLAIDLDADDYRLYPHSRLIVVIKPQDLSIDDFLDQALNHPLVYSAEINYPLIAAGTTSFDPIHPNDVYYDSQWNLQAIYMPYAWNFTQGSNSITVAVLDTGVDPDHPDLQQNLNLNDAYNVFEQNHDVKDQGRENNSVISHGTHVSGIIGATVNNMQGIAGIAWNIDLIPIRVIDSSNKGTIADLIDGINKAIELNVDIINLSLAIPNATYNQELHSVLQQAYAQDIIIVGAAGNAQEILYPAKHPEVIAVGSSTYQYSIAHYSAADQVRLFAPGGDQDYGIMSTDLESYNYGNGTSMAAPHVTGLIALILAANPSISNMEIEDFLWDTGIVMDFTNPEQRLVNAYAAITNTPITDITLQFDNLSQDLDSYPIVCDYNRHFSHWLPPGQYQVTAHIDSNNDHELSSGDWFYEDQILVEADDVALELEIRLEIYQ